MRQNYRLIFKNTLMLYGREVVTLLLSLYASRLLLEQLGVEDFGLYGLIGSILAMFSALRGLFATSIQRFISVEKAKGDRTRIRSIFSIGVLIHLIIAGVFIVVVEIAGLMMIPTLNIPLESFHAAYWVLHFSIIATAVTILTIPYDALIIANEKFDAFAIFSIIEAVLKVVIILLLIYSPIPKVICYTFLLLVVAIIIRGLNALYCRWAFRDDARLIVVRDKASMKELVTFAGWQFFGNIGFSLMHTGVNFIMNAFGGVAVNAARSIAYQVQAAVNKFTASVGMSFQPQSVMLYSQGDLSQFNKMMVLNTKLSFVVAAIMGSVIILMAPVLLHVWLGQVPTYTTELVQSIFVYTIIRSLHAPVDTLFKAAGKLKQYQLCEFFVLSLNLPLTWWILSENYPYYLIFLLMAVVELLNLFAILGIAQKYLGYKSWPFIKSIMPRVFIFMGIGVLVFCYLSPILSFEDSFVTIILQCFVITLIASLLVVSITFTSEEMKAVLRYVRKK